MTKQVERPKRVAAAKAERQHPERMVAIWDEIVPILTWVANDSRGLSGRQVQTLIQNARALNVYLTTGKVPFTGQVEVGGNGQQPAEPEAAETPVRAGKSPTKTSGVPRVDPSPNDK